MMKLLLGAAVITAMVMNASTQGNRPFITPKFDQAGNWEEVGTTDRFKRYVNPKTWEEGRRFCKSLGYEIYQPKDIHGVGNYIDRKYGDDAWNWIAGRGNGQIVTWVSPGQQPSRSDPWRRPNHYDKVGTDQCMVLATSCGKAEILMVSCSWTAPTLCGASSDTTRNVEILVQKQQ